MTQSFSRRTTLRRLAVALSLIASLTAAWAVAGTKAVVLKMDLDDLGAAVTGPIPNDVLLAAGASLIEDYEAMAVIDLGPADAEQLGSSLRMPVVTLPDHDTVFLHRYTLDARDGLPAGVTAEPFPADQPNLYLVVFRTIPKAEWLEDLEASKVEIVHSVYSNALVVFAPLTALQDVQARGGTIINILPFAPAFKLIREDSLYGEDGFSGAAVTLVDTPTSEAVIEVIKASATGAVSVIPVGNAITVWAEVPNDVAAGLVYHPEVVTVAPAARLEPSGERQALIVAGQMYSASEGGRTVYKPQCAVDYYSWLSSKGLANASDIYLGLLDTGLDTGWTSDVHADFKSTGCASRVQAQLNPATGLSCAPPPAGDPARCSDCTGHGTLVAAIMGGAGGAFYCNTQFNESASCSGGTFWAGTGIAPAAKIASAKIYPNALPYSITAIETGLSAFAGYDVWATNLSSNGAGTGYDGLSGLLDARVRDANGSGGGAPAMTIVVSAGNTTGQVLVPATGKNVIAVGASENYRPDIAGTTCPSFDEANNAHDVWLNSAAGAADGRIKPDLVAPGTRIMGALTRSAPDCCWPTHCGAMKQCGRNHPGYPDDGTLPGMGGANPITWSIGTSFAAPAVTGAAGLVSKWYKNGHGGIRSSPAMTKAMLINAALDIYGGRRGVQIVDHIPSPYQGWGKVDLTRATPPSSHWAVDQSWSLSSGQSFEIVLQRNNLGLPVRATLAWTDPAASDGDPHPLVNDLDLVIVASDGPCYAGNQFNEATGQSLAVSCASPTLDSNNNVENAIFSLTLTQWFRVKVIAKAGMQGTQDFALFVDNAYIY